MAHQRRLPGARDAGATCGLRRAPAQPAVHARTPEQRAQCRAPAAAAAWTFVERRVPVEPARFPWRFFAVLAGLAITAGLALAVLHEPDAEAPVHDQIIEAGSCVFVQGTGRVVEVTCGAPTVAPSRRW